jgi:hypothetical protein
MFDFMAPLASDVPLHQKRASWPNVRQANPTGIRWLAGGLPLYQGARAQASATSGRSATVFVF